MTVRSPVPPAGVVVLRLPAEVDLAVAPRLREELHAALSGGDPHLVVDGEDVTFMDSSGVNALVRAYETCVDRDGSLHVVTTATSVRRVLEITGLSARLGLVDSLDEAFRCLSTPETIHTCQAAES